MAPDVTWAGTTVMNHGWARLRSTYICLSSLQACLVGRDGEAAAPADRHAQDTLREARADSGHRVAAHSQDGRPADPLPRVSVPLRAAGDLVTTTSKS